MYVGALRFTGCVCSKLFRSRIELYMIYVLESNKPAIDVARRVGQVAFAQSFAASSNTIFEVYYSSTANFSDLTYMYVLGVPTCTYSTYVGVLYYAIYLIQAHATICRSAMAGGDVDTRVPLHNKNRNS